MDFPWLRKIQLTVGGKQYDCDGTQSTWRVTANVNQQGMSIPTVSNFNIYNLTIDDRKKVVRQGTRVECKAGWEKGPDAGLKTIFKGKITQVLTSRQGPDIITSIEACPVIGDIADGKTEHEKENVQLESLVLDTVKESWPNTKIGTVKVPQMTIEKISYKGTTRTFIDYLAEQYGFTWWISPIDESFNARFDKECEGSLKKVEPPYLIDCQPSYVGELMGKVQRDINVRCTFRADIVCGKKISVHSDIYDNDFENYFIMQVSHALDCYGTFATEFNALTPQLIAGK